MLPGLSGYVRRLFPIVRYLRKEQDVYDVTAIPLGASVADFYFLSEKVVSIISGQISKDSNLKEVVLFGHSHGGRVAVQSVSKLIEKHPNIRFSVITAGTPIQNMPINNKFYVLIWKLFSKSMRQWPALTIPELETLGYFIGFYSKSDKIVMQKYAESGYPGTLKEISNASHNDLIKPEFVGNELLRVMS